MGRIVEQLFLLEIMIERITLRRPILEKYYRTIEDASIPLSVTVKFLEFPCFEVNQEDFREQECLDAATVGDFSSGKSCLFSMEPLALIRAIKQSPIKLILMRKQPGKCQPELLGLTEVFLTTDMCKTIQKSVESQSDLPVSCTLQDSFSMRANSGEEAGFITIFVRMSCFGHSIVTQFKLVSETNSFLFKNSKQDTDFTCENCSCVPPMDEDTADAQTPVDLLAESFPVPPSYQEGVDQTSKSCAHCCQRSVPETKPYGSGKSNTISDIYGKLENICDQESTMKIKPCGCTEENKPDIPPCECPPDSDKKPIIPQFCNADKCDNRELPLEFAGRYVCKRNSEIEEKKKLKQFCPCGKCQPVCKTDAPGLSQEQNTCCEPKTFQCSPPCAPCGECGQSRKSTTSKCGKCKTDSLSLQPKNPPCIPCATCGETKSADTPCQNCCKLQSQSCPPPSNISAFSPQHCCQPEPQCCPHGKIKKPACIPCETCGQLNKSTTSSCQECCEFELQCPPQRKLKKSRCIPCATCGRLNKPTSSPRQEYCLSEPPCPPNETSKKPTCVPCVVCGTLNISTTSPCQECRQSEDQYPQGKLNMPPCMPCGQVNKPTTLSCQQNCQMDPQCPPEIRPNNPPCFPCDSCSQSNKPISVICDQPKPLSCPHQRQSKKLSCGTCEQCCQLASLPCPPSEKSTKFKPQACSSCEPYDQSDEVDAHFCPPCEKHVHSKSSSCIQCVVKSDCPVVTRKGCCQMKSPSCCPKPRGQCSLPTPPCPPMSCYEECPGEQDILNQNESPCACCSSDSDSSLMCSMHRPPFSERAKEDIVPVMSMYCSQENIYDPEYDTVSCPFEVYKKSERWKTMFKCDCMSTKMEEVSKQETCKPQVRYDTTGALSPAYGGVLLSDQIIVPQPAARYDTTGAVSSAFNHPPVRYDTTGALSPAYKGGVAGEGLCNCRIGGSLPPKYQGKCTCSRVRGAKSSPGMSQDSDEIDNGSLSEGMIFADRICKPKRKRSKWRPAKKVSRHFGYTWGGTYPGVKIGHQYCLQPALQTPARMGWLWYPTVTSYGYKPRPAWRPGAISRGVVRVMRSVRRAAAAQVLSLSSRSGSKMSERGDEAMILGAQEPELPPTVRIHRHAGQYCISMYPSNPKPGEKYPIQFNVPTKQEDDDTDSCGCESSDSSDLDIEFTTPGRPDPTRRWQKQLRILFRV